MLFFTIIRHYNITVSVNTRADELGDLMSVCLYSCIYLELFKIISHQRKSNEPENLQSK